MNDNIQNLIQTSTYRALSSNEEKVILDYLKSIPEVEAYEIIKSMVEQKSLISLVIAKRVLNQRDYVTKLFKYGSVNSNAQSIKLWLDFAIPKLGFKSVAKLIEDLNNDQNRLIEKAVYWFPLFISKNEKRSWNLLEKLRQKVTIHP
ncbi:MAG: hypothetical protein KME21_12255 [Desmonostoc vinosum HA7617-LM4]|jgi:hypothetical protein|nr:hypothetical protein [Desmonostoc vinosum HA7617-LM4]